MRDEDRAKPLRDVSDYLGPMAILAFAVVFLAGAMILITSRGLFSSPASASAGSFSPTVLATMATMQPQDTLIKKAIRNQANFVKSQTSARAATGQLIKLAQAAQTDLSAANADGIPASSWNGMMGKFIRDLKAFDAAVAAKGATSAQAKAAYRAVGSDCVACHTAFGL